jgi:adenosylcobinamide kinase/adenosylcobinamide-phosphate guanylyltransferase
MEKTLNTDKLILVLGGCRSGKSGYAMARADAMAAEGKLYLATSVPTDPEMEKRVARHQAERGPGWQTVEEPVLIDESIAVAGRFARVILVDCLTLWTSNLLFDQNDETEIMASVALLSKALKACSCPVILVSNEVGYGIVPENPLARTFRDMAGLVNQKIAAVADEVILCAAGIPVQIKPGPGGQT